MKTLTGRTAVVTGGGSGIGRGIALGLAAEGMKLAILDLNGESASGVASEIEQAGGEAIGFAVDVTSAQALEQVAKDVAGRLGGASLLCANAGVMLPLGPLAEKSADDWEYVFSVNVHGVVKTVAAFLPQLRAADEAHIVNTASLGGIVSVPQIPLGVYIASKYACVGYSECLREELAKDGIGVSVLCPGVVASDLYHTSSQQRPERYGGPEDVSLPAGGAAPPRSCPGWNGRARRLRSGGSIRRLWRSLHPGRPESPAATKARYGALCSSSRMLSPTKRH